MVKKHDVLVVFNKFRIAIVSFLYSSNIKALLHVVDFFLLLIIARHIVFLT